MWRHILLCYWIFTTAFYWYYISHSTDTIFYIVGKYINKENEHSKVMYAYLCLRDLEGYSDSLIYI